MENQIAAGLIEEVIQVAEGELKLVDTMLESKVYVLPHRLPESPLSSPLLDITFDARYRWEELEEKTPQGQWEYFGRDQHTPGTQEPPNK